MSAMRKLHSGVGLWRERRVWAESASWADPSEQPVGPHSCPLNLCPTNWGAPETYWESCVRCRTLVYLLRGRNQCVPLNIRSKCSAPLAGSNRPSASCATAVVAIDPKLATIPARANNRTICLRVSFKSLSPLIAG